MCVCVYRADLEFAGVKTRVRHISNVELGREREGRGDLFLCVGIRETTVRKWCVDSSTVDVNILRTGINIRVPVGSLRLEINYLMESFLRHAPLPPCHPLYVFHPSPGYGKADCEIYRQTVPDVVPEFGCTESAF